MDASLDRVRKVQQKKYRPESSGEWLVASDE